MEQIITTTLERSPDLAERLPFGPGWPEFIFHDPVARALMPTVNRVFSSYSVVLLTDDDEPIAGGWGVPLHWDGTVDGLPAGWDGALEQAVAQHEQGVQPNTLCAMATEVVAARQGEGIGADVLETLRMEAAMKGIMRMIAPARPTLKHRYPLTPIADYMTWRRADQTAFDPWLRSHERAGATFLAPEPAAMRITGTADEWEQWTGMPLPASGSYIVPQALAPVQIDRERNHGEYVEPGVWMAYRYREQ